MIDWAAIENGFVIAMRWAAIAGSGIYLGLTISVLIIYRMILKSGLATHRAHHVLALGTSSIIYVVVTAGWTATLLVVDAKFRFFWSLFLIAALAFGIYGLVALLEDEATILHRDRPSARESAPAARRRDDAPS